MCRKLLCWNALGLILCSVSYAADVDWTGSAGDGLWSNPANWSSNRVPAASDVVFLDVPAALSPNGPVIQSDVEARISGLVCEVAGEPTMTMTGGTLDISGYIWWGDGPNCFGTFYMSGGTVTTGAEFELGWGGGGGTWHMTGGTINAQELVIPTATGAHGTLYLYGGTCNVGSGGLRMTNVGLIDIGAGVLILEGDHVTQIDAWITSGQIIAYSGDGRIQRDYDVRNPGMTTVTATGTRKASEPQPADRALDVPCDVALSWTPGVLAPSFNGHIVYFGDNFDEVSEATNGVAQDASSCVPDQRLEFGKTYYWRVDEVNAAPDYTVYPGEVWQFTTEPYAYPITSVTAEAANEQPPSPASRTVDGSGLDEFDQHGVDVKTMWVGNLPAWIQYTFDKEYTLHEMWVWNGNSEIEAFMGFGAKDVTVEYSADGQNWTALENVPEFGRGAGTATYTANTVIGFGGVRAKYVRLTINATYGVTGIVALSEVRFFYVPVQAFKPAPADGATGVSVDTNVDWRPGRGATSHTVYIDTDKAAVAGGTAAPHTVTDHGYTPSSLDFSTQYFWKVDEASDAGAHAGDTWSFTTEEFAAVDDFEDYTDDIEAETTLWHAWIDGVTNGTGSYVGYETAVGGTFCETFIVHGGRQSMPVTYDNTKSPYYSEVERAFGSAQNWTAHGADTLSLYFQGVATNSPESLYVTVKDSSKSKTIAHSDAAAATVEEWQQWKIPLSELTAAGVKVTAVKALAIGVGNSVAPAAGGTGKVYIDDIGYGRSHP
ncbi:MAG: discoidin domain-containing protein [Phycisphaerales bacterium]